MSNSNHLTSRLSALCESLTDIPVAKRNLSAIVVKETQKRNQEALNKNPNDRDLLAQRSILDIWQAMQSEKVDNVVVYDAVVKALSSHDCPRKLDQAAAYDMKAVEVSTFTDPKSTDVKPIDVKPTDVKSTDVKATDIVDTEAQPWSIRVASAIFSTEVFAGRCVEFVLNERINHLELRIDGKIPEPTQYVDLQSIEYLFHSYSYECIQIQYSMYDEDHIDVRMHSFLDGKRFMDKIKSLKECTRALSWLLGDSMGRRERLINRKRKRDAASVDD
ncbi:MAG: hypothetical protein Q9213_002705 [Squamulea squamosa]